jgi:hypothetical protein
MRVTDQTISTNNLYADLNQTTLSAQTKTPLKKSRVKHDHEPIPWVIHAGRIMLFLGVVLIWEIAARLKVINPFFWSMPSEIIQTLKNIIIAGTVWTDIFYTIRFFVWDIRGSISWPFVLVV